MVTMMKSFMFYNWQGIDFSFCPMSHSFTVSTNSCIQYPGDFHILRTNHSVHKLNGAQPKKNINGQLATQIGKISTINEL